MEENLHLIQLFQHYLDGSASEKEVDELMLYINNPRYSDSIKQIIGITFEKHIEELDFDAEQRAVIFGNIINHEGKRYKTPLQNIYIWKRIAIAASVILITSIASVLVFNKTETSFTAQNQRLEKTILPGSNKAVLTLANGIRIVLTGSGNGKIAIQGNTGIVKTADGKIVYNDDLKGLGKNKVILYNTIVVPRGGQYHLVLADGSNVWLNAASSLKYPTAFNGSERKVELTGEAYFEVAHNPHKPFQVSANGQTVEVLGTHFNINAYADEQTIKTDLLEGSVKVSESGKQTLLKPGQESVASPNNSSIAVKSADTEMAVAWKNGLFSFKRADLQTVMRQISRWYNVDVLYQGAIPVTAITGTVDRNVNASQVLQILTNLGVPFKIDGKKIIIL